MEPKDIKRLFHKCNFGTATAEEQRVIEQWLSTDGSFDYWWKQQVSSSSDIMSDEAKKKTWQAINDSLNRHTPKSVDTPSKFHLTIIRRLTHLSLSAKGLAVAACVLFIAGLSWYFFHMARSTDIVKPVLSAMEQIAIERSEKVGRQEAVLTVGGKQTTLTTSAIAESPPIAMNFFPKEEDMECQLVTPKGKEYWMALSDGTVVHLDYGTRIIYPSHFAEKERRVWLEGAAYFKVAHDKDCSFYVQTRDGTVKDYGTEFFVNTRTGKTVTEVVLINGRIGLTSIAGKERMLNPGYRALMNSNTGDTEIAPVDITPYRAWNEGRMVFEDCPLPQLMRVLGLWFNRDIKIAENAVSTRFSGTIDRYGQLNDLLQSIENISDLIITDDGTTINVINK